MLPSLQWRRHYLDLLRVYDVMHADEKVRKELFTLCSEVSSMNLRRHRWAIHFDTPKTNVLKHYFTQRIAASWNNLPEDLVELPSFHLFKRSLKKYLMSNLETNPFKS